MRRWWRRTCWKPIKESVQFKNVTTDKLDSNLYVTSTLTNNEQGNIASAWLTRFTFFVIPTTFSNTFTLETVFKDQEGNVLGKIVKQESTAPGCRSC